MAKPQLENGYLRIALELVDAIARTHFTPNESKVFWCVLRKTYGWKKKADGLSLAQIAKMASIWRQAASRSSVQLSKRNILQVVRKQGKMNTFQIQKNYDIWDKLTINNIVDSTINDPVDTLSTISLIPSCVGLSTPALHTKDNIKILSKEVNFGVLETEVKKFKNLGYENTWIRSHFLMREFTEVQIDEVLSKIL